MEEPSGSDGANKFLECIQNIEHSDIPKGVFTERTDLASFGVEPLLNTHTSITIQVPPEATKNHYIFRVLFVMFLF